MRRFLRHPIKLFLHIVFVVGLRQYNIKTLSTFDLAEICVVEICLFDCNWHFLIVFPNMSQILTNSHITTAITYSSSPGIDPLGKRWLGNVKSRLVHHLNEEKTQGLYCCNRNEEVTEE